MTKKKASKARYSKKEKLKWLIGFGNRMSKKLKANMSHPEKKLSAILEELPYEYIAQEPIIIRDKYLYIMDFYFPKLKLCLEVQSFAFHTSPPQKKKDSVKKMRIKSLGIKMLYLWATQIEIIKKEEVDQILKTFC